MVAARIEAFQAGQRSSLEPEPGPRQRPTLVLAHVGDTDSVVGRGRRRELSFASPASRASRDGAEGARGNGRPPVGSPTRVLHPSFEEKEVFFRPISRASRPNTSHEIVDDEIGTSRCSSVVGMDNRFSRSSSIEHIDGMTELRAAKSRLRSIAERKESESKTEEKDELTLNDLEDMLDVAIGQNDSNDSEQTSLNEQTTKALSNEPSGQPSRSPKQSTKECNDGNHNVGSSVARGKSSFDGGRSYKTNNDGGILVKQDDSASLVPSCADVSVKERNQGTMNRRPSIFKRYNSRSRQEALPAMSAEPPKRWVVHTSKPPSSPVKERAAMFENPNDKLEVFPTELASPTSHHTGRRAGWSRYQNSANRLFSSPARKPTHHRRISSSSQTDAVLIPLKLPQLVHREKSRERAVGATHEAPSNMNETQTEVDKSPAPTVNPSVVERQIELPLTPDFTATEHLADALLKSKPDAVPKQPGPSVRRSSRGIPSPRKCDSTVAQDSGLAFPITTPAAPGRSARSSIVESRIQDLMAASRQTGTETDKLSGTTHEAGKVKQRVLFEGVANMESGDTKKIPALQVPIYEQAQEVDAVTPMETQSPTKLTQTCQPNITAPVPRERPQSPVKPAMAVSSTPPRGRSRKVKQSLSPRGIPYAIEQRFSLSPSRSRSRRGESGVFVSVEVRSSPEKGRGDSNEHEIVIRASVEPDDVTDDTD